MTILHVDRFRQKIIDAAEVYGGAIFWNDILMSDGYAENLWRGMLFVGCARLPGYNHQVYSKLNHPDSRVRAYGCFALGQLGEMKALNRIDSLMFDPSPRVRIHARFAHQTLTGDRFNGDENTPREGAHKDKVLISEDSGLAQEQLIEGLTGLNLDLEVASTAEETIDKALQLRPRVIITDNQKWGDNTSGLRMISQISRTPELQEIVIFMLTADPIEAALLWHGGDMHFIKGQYALAGLGYQIASYLRGPINEIIIKNIPVDPSRLN